MDVSSERWWFWDSGHRQFVQDTLTGEVVMVHGDGAKFTDGPFKLLVDDNDRPVVVGLLGDDDDCALHFVDEEMANGVTLEVGVKGQWHHMVRPRCGDEPARTLAALQGDKKTLV